MDQKIDNFACVPHVRREGNQKMARWHAESMKAKKQKTKIRYIVRILHAGTFRNCGMDTKKNWPRLRQRSQHDTPEKMSHQRRLRKKKKECDNGSTDSSLKRPP